MLFEGLGRGVFYAIYTLNLWEPHIMFFVLEFKKKYFNDKVKKKKSLYKSTYFSVLFIIFVLEYIVYSVPVIISNILKEE